MSIEKSLSVLFFFVNTLKPHFMVQKRFGMLILKLPIDSV